MTTAAWMRKFVTKHPEYQVGREGGREGGGGKGGGAGGKKVDSNLLQRPTIYEPLPFLCSPFLPSLPPSLPPSLQRDSVVSPSIAYDLMMECKRIGEGRLQVGREGGGQP